MRCDESSKRIVWNDIVYLLERGIEKPRALARLSRSPPRLAGAARALLPRLARTAAAVSALRTPPSAPSRLPLALLYKLQHIARQLCGRIRINQYMIQIYIYICIYPAASGGTACTNTEVSYTYSSKRRSRMHGDRSISPADRSVSRL